MCVYMCVCVCVNVCIQEEKKTFVGSGCCGLALGVVCTKYIPNKTWLTKTWLIRVAKSKSLGKPLFTTHTKRSYCCDPIGL